MSSRPSGNIPTSILSKLDKCEIEIEGTIIKTDIVVHEALLETCISELRSLSRTSMPLIGVDIKSRVWLGNKVARILILCVKDRCLIVRLDHIGFPDCLRGILAHEGLCFVGVKVSDINLIDMPIKTYKNWAFVELGHLVASGLKKPRLEKCGIGELAYEVGFNWKEPEKPVTSPEWSRTVFSTEEIKHMIHSAYSSYAIGTKLLSMI